MIRPSICTAGIALGALLCASAAAFAQNQDRDKDRARAENRGGGDVIRATALKGLKVETDNGEALGTIENVAMDVSNGKLVFAIIDSTNVQGRKNKLTAVPFPALTFNNRGTLGKLDITTAKFDEQSQFNTNGWNTIGDRSWGQILYRTWALEDEWNKVVQKSDFDRDNNVERGEVDTEIGPDGKPRLPLVKMTEVIGRDVRTNERQDVGKVQDLGADVGKDKIVFAVISTGEVEGMDNKLVAVPFPVMNLHSSDRNAIVRADRSMIKNAPSFEQTNWPDMADARWSKRVRDHFNVSDNDDVVYGYDDDDDENDNGRTVEAADRTMRGWEFNSAYNRQFQAGSVQTFSGRVTSIDRDVPMSGMAPAVILKVQRDNNQTATVHLGPVWFIDRQSNMFKNGDQVEITGAQVDFEGKSIVMATHVNRDGRTMVLRRQNGDPVWDVWSRANEIRNRE